MRIALVIERMDASRGGRERSVAEIAAELAGRGHDVTVLCREGGLDAAGVEVLDLGAGGLGRAGRLAKFAEAVGQVARREAYEIVHATLPVPGANVYQPRGGTIPGQIAGRRRRLCAPGRAASRLFLPLNFARMCAWRLERRIVAEAGVTCVALSQMVAEEFAAYYGRRENVRVVYGGVEVPQADEAMRSAWRAQWRGRWGAADETVVFVSVARNLALKGVAEAIEAFAEYMRLAGGAGLPARDARLVIVGGKKVRPCRRLAEVRGLGGRVIFQEAVSNVFELYSAAEAVVLLSWQDACSRVVLEAIRWSVPSLTSRFNGAAELLTDGAGVVVESPRDRSGIVAAMNRLSDPCRRRRMAGACLDKADFASNRRQVDELEKVYKEIAGRKGPAKRGA